MVKKILVLCGNPVADSFSGTLADRYQAAAEDAGHEVLRINIADLDFDPVLRQGYNEEQPLEPDLINVQAAIRAVDHIVIIYPNWWSAMPAILKGLFDRIWQSGFAFTRQQDSNKVDKLLSGRTARVIITSGTYHPFSAWWNYGDYTNEIQYAILEFAGIRTSVTSLGPVQSVGDEKRGEWIKEIEKLARRGV